MKAVVSFFVGFCAVAMLISACASTPEATIVSSSTDSVTIAIDQKEAKNLSAALQGAGQVAEKSCDKTQKTAKLNHTEDSADGIIAYYDCITPPPAPKPSS